MTIKRKLLLNSIIALGLSILIIGFIIFNMLSIQSSNQDKVPLLLLVQKLEAETSLIKQSLYTFSYNKTDRDKQDALVNLQTTDQLFKSVEKLIVQPESKEILSKAYGKFEKLKVATENALNSRNSDEVNRQAIRTEGILNDLYLLNSYVKNDYENFQLQLKAQIKYVITSTLIGSLILILVSIIFSVIVTNSITKPLKKLANNAEKIASGDLSVDPIIYKGKDELGKLNLSFSTMVRQLNGLIHSIELASKQLEEFSEEIVEENQALKNICNQVAISTDELSSGSQSISEDLQSTVKLIELMDRQFDHSVKMSKQSVIYSEKAINAIQIGNQVIEKQRFSIEENINVSRSIEDATEKFTNYTTNIESMAKTVSTIADQTNLLALNATIEAARAGEAGKGFAIVANEVRELAEKSTGATKQIFDMVNLIKNGLTDMIQTVQTGVEMSSFQMESMDSTTEAFKQIEKEVECISLELEILVIGMTKSKDLSDQVTNNVENISVVIEQSTAGSEEISASTSEQFRSFEKMLKKVMILRKLTEDLNQEVGKFNVKTE